MPTITNNLFPPVLPDSQPAFIRTQNFRIYFSLSDYNNLNDIKNVQISIKNQKTNRSALNPTKYPSEIKLIAKSNIITDNTVTTAYKYYVQIPIDGHPDNSDIVSGYLNADQSYLVQMRFTSINALDPPSTAGIDTWLFTQRDYFSEWSTVCLIKGIEQPSVVIKNLTVNTTTPLNTQFTKLIGSLNFTSLEEIKTEWTQGNLQSDGTLSSSNPTKYIYTGYLDISNVINVLFSFSRPNTQWNYNIFCYNDSKTHVVSYSNQTISKTLKQLLSTTYNIEDIAYIRLKIYRNNSTPLTADQNTVLITRKIIVPTASTETEYLKSYSIKISKMVGTTIGETVYKTDQIYTNQYSPNEFNQQIPYEFDTGINHRLEFSYTTNNGYKQTLIYSFNISAETIVALDGNVVAIPEPDRGRIKIFIDFDFQGVIQTNKNLIVKRASSRTNFKIWETLMTVPHTSYSIKNIWYDTTIESGVWYKYKVEEEANNEDRRSAEIQEPVICVFEDIYLTNGTTQLKIKFNPSIGDFKYNTMESQQNTLGSKFPYVRRNGNNFFRSFSIGGLITALMDDNDWYDNTYYNGQFIKENKRMSFTSPIDLYKDSRFLYSDYNKQYNINEYNDYIYEREFRQKVSDFLYKNEIKLFKSLTEGNILIKLQNVSFQPTNELGRRLYSFTATAIEIDDISLENFIKYNVANKYYYTYKKYTTNTYTNLNNKIIASGESVLDYLFTLSNLTTYEKENVQFFKLNFTIDAPRIICVKRLNDPQIIKYTTAQAFIDLPYDEENPIEVLYPYGIKFTNYTVDGNYYTDLEDIQNPVLNKVYYIYYMTTEEYLINNYISYDAKERLLNTTQDETSIMLDQNYVLHADALYEKYIYYRWNNVNHWYKITEDDEVLVDTKFTRMNACEFEAKEMN